VLLQVQVGIDGHTAEDHPLTRYAAEHWTTHAQFGEVSLRLRKGMEYLFDSGKPHFRVWFTLYDIDTRPLYNATFYNFAPHDKSGATPLYYAALCGFYNLVEYLIAKYPQDVNANGGHYTRPLVAALAGEHFQIADLLRHNGADLHVRGINGATPLHSAAYHENLEVVRKLIEYDSDIEAEDEIGRTPLHWVSYDSHFKDGSVLRLLLEHGADVNAREKNGHTPSHVASYHGALRVIRLLLEHGADLDAKRNDGKTPLQVAADKGFEEVVKSLREQRRWSKVETPPSGAY